MYARAAEAMHPPKLTSRWLRLLVAKAAEIVGHLLAQAIKFPDCCLGHRAAAAAGLSALWSVLL
jgi:hypothetical protein